MAGDGMEVEEQKAPAASTPAPVPALEEEEEVPEEKKVPDMALAQRCWVAVSHGDKEAAADVMAAVREHSMAPWFSHLTQHHPEVFPPDDALLAEMRAANVKEAERLDKAIEEAEADSGDMEVLDAHFAKARLWATTGAKEEAENAYGAITDRPKMSTGRRIDAVMELIRVALFHMDKPQVREGLDRAKKLIEQGGDWDRRNRLKVYEALYLISARDISGAAALLLECVATFTCVELCSYEDFIFYTVVTNVLSIPRTTLKKKIIDGPEVLAVIVDIPNVSQLVNSLHACDYSKFMHAMVEVNSQLQLDRYFAPHTRHLVRELRILAYTQFLDAYKSVILSSMATAFGVGEDFLDKELSRFIAAGRLNAKIDKVGGVVETNRPDKKNAQYQSAIKQGDLLLNRVQKLARVMDS